MKSLLARPWSRPRSSWIVLLSVGAWASVASPAWSAPTQTTMVPMRDQVNLATDIYLPAGAGPFPVVLHRTPYAKAGFETSAQALLGANVASVAQDMRGRYDSEGVDCVFRCDGDGEAKDGLDTLDWIAAQPWCNGNVVTYGGSATGIVQYMAAVTSPVVLDGMWVEAASPSLYDHGFFQGGVFRKGLMEGWLEGQGSWFFLQDIAAHPLLDDFWTPVQTADRFGQVKVPAMHVGGWYDIFAQGTIDAFVGYQHQGGVGAAGKQKMILGPWTHSGFLQAQQGDLTYPDNARDLPVTYSDTLFAWLIYHLGLDPNPAAVDAIPTVQYYVMGDVDDPAAPGNEWRTADDWPVAAAPVRLHLQSGGVLAETCPQQDTATSSYVYDPNAPSPTVGGAELLLPAGPKDQAAIEARSDVVTFSTPVLAEPLEVTGRVSAHIWVSIDRPDTDLMVRMTDVYPDGRSMLVLDAPVRLATRSDRSEVTPLQAGQVVEAVVDLWSTSLVFNAGHRLRISITSSNSPRFQRSPNDGSNYGGPSSPAPVTVTLHHDASYPSYLEIPVPGRDDSTVVVCEVAVPDGGAPDGATDGGPGGDASTGDGSVNPEGGADAGADAGAGPKAPVDDGGDGNCACGVAGKRSAGPAWVAAAMAALAFVSRRRPNPAKRRGH